MQFLTTLWQRFEAKRPPRPARAARPDAPVHPHPVALAATEANRFIVLREAVLDRGMEVAGYEFSQAGDRVAPGVELEREKALLAHVRGKDARALAEGRTLFVTTTHKLLSDPAVEKLPRREAVLLLRAASLGEFDEPLLERMRSLARKGIAVGLADGRAALEHEALARTIGAAFFPLADFLPPDLVAISRRLARLNPALRLGVRGVQTQDEFDACARLNFAYLQGPLVRRREEWSRNHASPSALRICDLLGRVRGKASLREIAAQVRLDPMLSYRLLRLANSAALGAMRAVTSIEETVLLVGREPLYRWLALLLCVSAPPSPGHAALLEAALARGRLMELLAGRDGAESERQALFLTGMLSLLDVLLKVPMDTLLAQVRLPAEVGDAIVHGRGPCALPLQLAEACEEPSGDRVAELCARLELEPEAFNAALAAAGAWARETVGRLRR